MDVGATELLQALADVPDPPCLKWIFDVQLWEYVEHRCRWWDVCSTQKTACLNFMKYVVGENKIDCIPKSMWVRYAASPQHPSTEAYEHIFETKAPGRPKAA